MYSIPGEPQKQDLFQVHLTKIKKMKIFYMYGMPRANNRGTTCCYSINTIILYPPSSTRSKRPIGSSVYSGHMDQAEIRLNEYANCRTALLFALSDVQSQTLRTKEEDILKSSKLIGVFDELLSK